MTKPYRLTIRLLLIALLALSGTVTALAQEATPEPPVDPATTEASTSPPYLGISYSTTADSLTIRVQPGTPADEGGLLSGDVITAIDGEAVDAEALADTIAQYSPGDTITITVERDGETQNIAVTLGERPAVLDMRPGRGAGPLSFDFDERPVLGVQIDETEDGITVVEVSPGSPGAEAGLQTGDIILSVDDEPIESAEQLVDTIRAMAPGEVVTVTVEREGEPLTLSVTLGRGPILRMGDRPVAIFSLSSEIAYLPEENAWEVQSLDENSPLVEAGLMEGDRITAVNGEPFSPDLMPDLMPLLTGAEDLTLTIEREGETVDIEVSPMIVLRLIIQPMGLRDQLRGTMPGDMGPRSGNHGPRDDRPFGNRAQLGVAFLVIDAQVAEQYDLTVEEGALITAVLPNSPADAARLQVNDVVTSINGESVDAENTLADRVAAYDIGDTITLEIIRESATLQLEVTLGQGPDQASAITRNAPMM
ncbi:MAG: PDZ domain-containing protein [Chloroflexota bacterium]